MSAWARLMRPILAVWVLSVACGWILERLYPAQFGISTTLPFLGLTVFFFTAVWISLKRQKARNWIKDRSPIFHEMGSKPGGERDDFLVWGLMTAIVSIFAITDHFSSGSLNGLALFTGGCWLLPLSLTDIYLSRQIPKQETSNERTR
ncbi:hypothetical protein ACRAQ6_11195 [Erythrobacter sp. HA6-11]